MKIKNKLNKLTIDIIVAVIIFAFIACALFVTQQQYVGYSEAEENDFLDEDAWGLVRNVNAGKIAENAPDCLVVYNGNDETSVTLKNNISFVLGSVNVSVKEQKLLLPVDSDLDDEDIDKSKWSVNLYDYTNYDDVIFCISDMAYLGVDINDFSNWLSGGGHAMFAMGLDASEDLLKWSEVIGVTDTTIPELTIADSLKFNTSIMAGVEGRIFSDDVINVSVPHVSLDKDCILHISTADDDEVPLLWEKSVEDGKVIVSNADLFESKADRGILVAAYCEFYSAFAYPVINSAVYCIDDCPAPAPAGYDDNVREQYGYTVSDYIYNVWMPAMQKISEEYGIRFTTFVIQSYDDNVEGPFDNKDNVKSAKYYASQVMNMGGEVGIHGYNHQPLVLEGFEYDNENAGYVPWPSVKKMIESVDTVIKYTEGLADDLYVQAYIAPSNVMSKEALAALQNHFEDLRIYAGVYIGTSDQLVQEFEVSPTGIVSCPRLTADMQMEDSEWWVQINELNYHYLESNFIHPDDILDEERTDGGDFAQMLSGYKNMIEWNQRNGLRTCTISECGAAVQRYYNLNYSQKLEGDTLNIEVDGLIDTAYMMLRVNGKEPASVSGGTYTKLSDNVYVLKIDSKNVSIKLVEQQ